MIEPDDFGLGWRETLSHVTASGRCRLHGAFWQQWERSLDDLEPELVEATGSRDPSDRSVTHTLRGSGGVVLGCRLREAEGPAKALVVLLHGYSEPPTLAESLEIFRAAPGCAVLAVRMRGYAGSRLGVGDLTSSELGWITHGLTEPPECGQRPSDWTLSHAVADVLLAVEAGRTLLGDDIPVYLRGESFGGGLSVLAAACTVARCSTHPLRRIDRISMGVPTFGDWRWRMARTHPRAEGAGGELKRYLMASGDRVEGIETMLDLFDTAVHARRVECPALVKVAVRDEVVPAPTQSAVYNALGTPPGLKARFVAGYGHFDGGLTDLRRHALFDRMSADFLDPDRAPMDVIGDWQSVLTSGTRPPEAMSEGSA